MVRFEQKATVTQLTASSDEMSCPPTQPCRSESSTCAPAAARAERNEPSYVRLRKVT